MRKPSVSLRTRVRAAADQVSSDLGEETVILDLKQSVYHGLDETGSRIWQLVQNPTTAERISSVLLEEYEVEPQRCQQDVLTLLQELADNGLVEVDEQTA